MSMDDSEILARIHELVTAEHAQREHPDAAGPSARQLEETLDQCWDLLRQRRARTEFDQDPDAAQVRPVGEVENYIQ
jgi:hypothetical protein